MAQELSPQAWMDRNTDRFLPHVSIDCVVFGFHENQLRVLLLRFKNTDAWCLPGGRVYREESVHAAAYRVLEERTGLRDIFLHQFHTFGDPGRLSNTDFRDLFARQGVRLDPSSTLVDRTVSVGYYALVEFARVNAQPDLFSDECRWWDVRELPSLIFDHNHIASAALQALRQHLSLQPVGINLLPEKFTMPELQRLYETILGRELDRRNFQKRMLGYDFLVRLDERRQGGAYKSPFLYRFDKEKYDATLNKGNMIFI